MAEKQKLVKYDKIDEMPEEEALGFIWYNLEMICHRAYQSSSMPNSYSFEDSIQLTHMLLSMLSRYTKARSRLDNDFNTRVTEQVEKLRAWGLLKEDPTDADKTAI